MNYYPGRDLNVRTMKMRARARTHTRKSAHAFSHRKSLQELPPEIMIELNTLLRAEAWYYIRHQPSSTPLVILSCPLFTSFYVCVTIELCDSKNRRYQKTGTLVHCVLVGL